MLFRYLSNRMLNNKNVPFVGLLVFDIASNKSLVPIKIDFKALTFRIS